MQVNSLLFMGLFYLATTILLWGLAYKIIGYVKTPSPLKIPLMPAPMSKSGVGFRLFREIAFFESLFRANLWTWIFGYLFHVALLLVLLRHLRYFIEPVILPIAMLQSIGVLASFLMITGLTGLLMRRFLVERIRYISGYSDYLMLLLLIGIGLSGMAMKFVEHTDVIAVKTFMLGLLTLQSHPLPTDPILIVHLLLVILLMIIFPFSKLLHVPGIFFSPTRNQVDDAREKRHISDWALKYESNKPDYSQAPVQGQGEANG